MSKRFVYEFCSPFVVSRDVKHSLPHPLPWNMQSIHPSIYRKTNISSDIYLFMLTQLPICAITYIEVPCKFFFFLSFCWVYVSVASLLALFIPQWYIRFCLCLYVNCVWAAKCIEKWKRKNENSFLLYLTTIYIFFLFLISCIVSHLSEEHPKFTR